MVNTVLYTCAYVFQTNRKETRGGNVEVTICLLNCTAVFLQDTNPCPFLSRNSIYLPNQIQATYVPISVCSYQQHLSNSNLFCVSFMWCCDSAMVVINYRPVARKYIDWRHIENEQPNTRTRTRTYPLDDIMRSGLCFVFCFLFKLIQY